MNLRLKLARLMPLIIVIFVNAIGFMLVFIQKGDSDRTILYYSIGLIAMLLFTYCVILFGNLGDDILFLIVSMLVSIGVIMLYRLGTAAAIRQILWFYVGVLGFYAAFIMFSLFNFWNKGAVVYVASSIALFVLTLVFGSSIGGARNWIIIGEFSMQTSEVIKVLYIFAVCAIYTDKYFSATITPCRFYNTERGRELVVLAVSYVFFGFLILQREWGSALLNFATLFVLQYIFGSSKLLLALNVCLSSIAGIIGVVFLPHIQTRIEIWRDPFVTASAGGYQIVQSLYAMASGGFMGSGLGLGVPHLIPLAKSDFIFAAICEELGALGGIAVILLFFVLVYRGIKISLVTVCAFRKAIAVGISVTYAFQSFIIIGGTTKLIPLTGITLPFMSAGGSSLLVSFISLGVLQAISRDNR